MNVIEKHTSCPYEKGCSGSGYCTKWLTEVEMKDGIMNLIYDCNKTEVKKV